MWYWRVPCLFWASFGYCRSSLNTFTFAFSFILIPESKGKLDVSLPWLTLQPSTEQTVLQYQPWHVQTVWMNIRLSYHSILHEVHLQTPFSKTLLNMNSVYLYPQQSRIVKSNNRRRGEEEKHMQWNTDRIILGFTPFPPYPFPEIGITLLIIEEHACWKEGNDSRRSWVHDQPQQGLPQGVSEWTNLRVLLWCHWSSYEPSD